MATQETVRRSKRNLSKPPPNSEVDEVVPIKRTKKDLTNGTASQNGLDGAAIGKTKPVKLASKKAQQTKIKRETKKPAKKNSKKAVPASNVKTEPDSDQQQAGPSKKSRVKKGKAKVKSEPANNSDVNDNKVVQPKRSAIERSVVKKGKIPVDGLCSIATTSHVFCDDDIWDCMLNQTNIQFNNNKYYLIQLLKDDSRDAYSVWMRWGRVGCNGQNSLHTCGSDLDKAKGIFTKKFNDKTRNSWDMRDCFEKVPGKYDLLQMDYETKEEDSIDSKVIKKEENKLAEPPKKIESKLKPLVKALIELICDVRVMEEAVVEMKYDAKKAPLGKITADQVKAGYRALKEIDDLLSGSGKWSNKDLVQACNDFYTRIPHYFGMKVPPLIRTKTDIQEKMSLLQSLSDIQVAMSILGRPQDSDLHPADQHYNNLQCDIEPLLKDDSQYKLLKDYLSSTHGKTHSLYKMELLDIYKVTKTTEGQRFKDYGNRMLLWHGSRLANWAGILGQGLRIAPPEAPTTGYMFGKGIYFADMSSKSANYCMTTSRNNIGLLVLCDVSLGKCNELCNADYNGHKLPAGCHSVKGVGKVAPDPKNYKTLDDGVLLPMGPGVETKNNNPRGYTLQYNEYIVYDVAQVQIKYIFKIKFKY